MVFSEAAVSNAHSSEDGKAYLSAQTKHKGGRLAALRASKSPHDTGNYTEEPTERTQTFPGRETILESKLKDALQSVDAMAACNLELEESARQTTREYEAKKLRVQELEALVTREAEEMARLRAAVSADEATQRSLREELTSAKQRLSVAEASAQATTRHQTEGGGDLVTVAGHDNVVAERDRITISASLPEPAQKPVGSALEPNISTVGTAATALQALAAEAEELLGSSAQDTLRLMGGVREGPNTSSTLLLRASSPVEHISTELQREAQVLEALASPRALSAPVFAPVPAPNLDANSRLVVSGAPRKYTNVQPPAVAAHYAPALAEESVPPATTAVQHDAAHGSIVAEESVPPAAAALRALDQDEVQSRDWQPAVGIANDHIDTLSLSSGISTSSERERTLEYLRTERRFLSNRGLDGAQVELFFSVVSVSTGLAQHPLDDDYRLQWRPVPDPVELSVADRQPSAPVFAEPGDIMVSEVADITFDDPTLTLELHPPYEGLQSLCKCLFFLTLLPRVDTLCCGALRMGTEGNDSCVAVLVRTRLLAVLIAAEAADYVEFKSGLLQLLAWKSGTERDNVIIA
jgi:hypothetical protein